MATVSFLYRSIKDKSPLKVRLFFVKEGKNTFVECSLRTIVGKEYWEKYHFAKRVSDISMKNIQTELRAELVGIERLVLESFLKVSLDGVTKVWLQRVVDSYYSVEESGNELLKWMKMYIAFKKGSVADKTFRRYEINYERIKDYVDAKCPGVLVKDIDVLFKQEYEKYCRERLYYTSTISKWLNYIMNVCRYAALNGVETSPTLHLVNLKSKSMKKAYLTEDDIEAIEKLELDNKVLDNARDKLLISCYTGQRYGDFNRFDKSMLVKRINKKGEEIFVLEFIQQKTKKVMGIPVTKKMLKILEKRNGEFPTGGDLSEYNRYIRKVCKKAKINEMCFGSVSKETDYGFRDIEDMYPKHELVSSHIGRRSFATNNYGKIPTMYIMQMTGHSTEAIFLEYIGKTRSDMAVELSEYFE